MLETRAQTAPVFFLSTAFSLLILMKSQSAPAPASSHAIPRITTIKRSTYMASWMKYCECFRKCSHSKRCSP
jgi:hypothetical protein